MKMVAGAASKSAALAYEASELSHTLPGNKMVEHRGIAPHPSRLQRPVQLLTPKLHERGGWLLFAAL